MTLNDKTVFVAHYNKDISWIDKIDKRFGVVVYSAGEPGCVKADKFVPNKGMDAGMYLRFIIDNYSDLPKKTLFVHHHEMDWSQEFSLPIIINNLKWDTFDYVNVGAYYNYWHVIPPANTPPGAAVYNEYLSKSWHIFEPYLEMPKESIITAGTQFMANRELFLQYPLSFYQNAVDWLMQTDLPDWFTGRLFEHNWHYILTKNPIDVQRRSEVIFDNYDKIKKYSTKPPSFK